MNQQAELMEQVCQSVRRQFYRTHDNFRVDEDIVSFVTVEIVKAAAKHDASRGRNFSSWLYYKRDRAIQDYWKTYYRHDKYGLSFTSLDAPVNKQDEIVDDNRYDTTEPITNELSPELTRSIHRLVDDLNDRDRFVIIERFWNGRTQAQIAEMLGVSVPRINKRLTKILGRMREAA